MKSRKEDNAQGSSSIFHAFSSNLPHLQSWIEELILMTEQSLPVNNHPTADILVQSLQRYDAVFKELLRQCSIFSESITQMYSKLWAGVLTLMKYMIKSYHRYVRQTSHLQDQAQSLLNERQRDQAANKVTKEEFELTVTALRARIRNLESEQESLFISRKVLEHENSKLRKIIDVYIRSAEMNEPVWDIMNVEEGLLKKDQIKETKKVLMNESGNTEVDLGHKRKNVVDEGKNQLRNLNRLDIELNEILTNTLKEENRQRLLLKDLMRLLVKNKDLLLASPDTAAELVSSKLMRTSSLIKMPPIQKVGTSRQALSINTSFLGNLSTNHSFAAERVEIGVQIDDKDELGLILSIDEHEKIDVMALGVAPLAPTNVHSPGLDFPFLIRRSMSSFPTVLRVPPIAWACQSILAIYLDKIETDKERSARGLPKLSLPSQIYEFYKTSLGLPSAADVQVALLLKACEAHLRRQSRISLFASQIGLLHKEMPPSMDVRDTDFILQILECLVRQGELTAENLKFSKKRNVLQFGTFTRPDISRTAAISTVHELFRDWLPDGGEDYSLKVKTMQPSELGPRYVDLDQFIELLIEPWHLVRSIWEEHAKFLFKENCSTFRVLQEASFANDEGVKASDTIVVEIKKTSAAESYRRPLRIFQKTENNSEDKEGTSMTNATGKEAVCELIGRKAFVETILTINPAISPKEAEDMFEEALDLSHDSVLRALELLWTRYIDHASNYTVTGVSRQNTTRQSLGSFTEQLDDFASDLLVRPKANHRVVGTNREFWVNTRTSISQWTRPFFPRTFRSQELEVDVFVQVLIRKDVFPKSPFTAYLNLPPRDLWPASSTLHKQIMEKTTKFKDQQKSV